MADEKKVVEVPEKFKDIVASIEKMSVLDLSELVKVLEEKTSFNVELTDSGSNKIGVIKVIRELTQMGLKDAKDLVDTAPKMIKEGVSKADAEAWKKKFEEAGAKVTLK